VKKSYLFAAVSIFFWSTTATATKLLLSSFTALQILSVTSPVAFLFLLVLCAVKGEFEELRCMKLREILLTLGVGALGTFFYNFLLYQAIGMMAASQAFIINYLWPLMTVLFAVPILKEKMTLRKALALCLAFSGVIVVTSGGAFSSFSKDSLKGSVICISAAVVYGLFSALTKRSSVSRYLAMMLAYGAASVLAFTAVALEGDFFLPTLPEMGGLLYMGICTCAVAFTTWALALKTGDTTKISCLAYLTPFLSFLWTMLVLGEPFRGTSLLGLGLIVGGILAVMWKDLKKSP